MVDYDVMLMIIGQLQTACSAVWPTVIDAWPAIFISDWISADITQAKFLEMMAYAGPEYRALSECMITVK